MSGFCGNSETCQCSDEVGGKHLHIGSPFDIPAVFFAAVSEESLSNFALHPSELELLGESVSAKRRQDFALGRCAARIALGRAGVGEDTPVLRGEGREPIWPSGLVGSISHGGGYGIAAVAQRDAVPAVGIDIQPIEDRYSDELIARFADPDEFDWVRSDPAKRTERAVKLFSAKESVFKALYPIGKVWFAFDVAHLTPGASEDRFSAHVRLPSLDQEIIELEIGVRVCSGMVVTGAVLARPLSGKGMHR